MSVDSPQDPPQETARHVDCSIVVPVYYNEGSLTPTFRGLQDTVLAAHPQLGFEVIFVDDGSGDGSLAELLALRNDHADVVRVIKFSRNFGQYAALLAGFHHATGQRIVGVSADGQEPPELLNQMLAASLNEDYEVVAGVREGRDESLFRRVTSRWFYALIRKLSFASMPLGGFDTVLFTRKAMNAFLRNSEAHPFFQGQVLWLGFPCKFIPYQRKRREIGESRWTTAMKLTYLIDAVMSYSYFPLRLMSVVGFSTAILGVLYAVFIFFLRISIGPAGVPGWAGLMIVVLLLGGIQMTMLGTLGEYVWRILAQSRHREPYIIDKTFE